MTPRPVLRSRVGPVPCVLTRLRRGRRPPALRLTGCRARQAVRLWGLPRVAVLVVGLLRAVLVVRSLRAVLVVRPLRAVFVVRPLRGVLPLVPLVPRRALRPIPCPALPTSSRRLGGAGWRGGGGRRLDGWNGYDLERVHVHRRRPRRRCGARPRLDRARPRLGRVRPRLGRVRPRLGRGRPRWRRARRRVLRPRRWIEPQGTARPKGWGGARPGRR